MANHRKWQQINKEQMAINNRCTRNCKSSAYGNSKFLLLVITFGSSLLSSSKLIASSQTRRILINNRFRAMSSGGYLVDDPKYSFLKDQLKLERVNNGVYNGKWGGSGPAVKSIGKMLNLTQFVFPNVDKNRCTFCANKMKETKWNDNAQWK